MTTLRTAIATLISIVFAAVSLAAQTPDGWVLVKPGDQVETLPATPLVFVAYAFVWLALIGYVFFVWRGLARVEGELADIRQRLGGRPR
jgi:CcmD family protein